MRGSELVASIRRPTRRSFALVISTICALVALFGLTANAGAITRSGGTGTDPWIASELPDYAPGSVVNLLGGSWQPGEAVHITVNDNDGQTWVRNVDVTADSNGDISDTFSLPNWFIATYGVTATGATGSVATSSFTDGNLTSVSGTVTDSVTLAAISGATLTCNTTSGCNNTFTTTTDASGNYSFAGSNKLAFAGNGPATLTLSVAKAGYTTGTITLSNVNNGDTLTGRNIALVPSGPTKLGFTTSALTGAVGTCLGPITVQTQNASGTATNVTSNATVNLATDAGGTGAGGFYGDSSCSAAITSRTIAAGSSSASFYYSATGRGGGSHQLTASAAGLTSASQTQTITKADQGTLSITSPSSMTYGDPDATIAVTGGSGTGVVTFDAGASTACSIVSGKLHVVAGTGTCSITATKAGDGNYNPTTSAAHGVNVNRRDLTVTANGLNKIYDGATNATVTLTTDKLAGDSVNAAYASASFSNKHVGTGKTVTVTGISISGADASNYNLTNATAATSADITPRPITIAAVTDSKVYDGTTSSDETPVITVGLYASGDAPSFSQAYADKSVGTGRTLIPSGAVADGNGGDNYAVTFVNDTTGVITAKGLTIDGAVANSKVYDGDASATVDFTGASLDGVVSGDSVSIDHGAYTATFGNKSVGQGKPVTVTGVTLGGGDAGNYALSQPSGLTADITARDLTVTAHGVDKIYDGTSDATVTLTTDELSGDAVSAAYTSASFANDHAGAGKPVSVNGISISGADAGNYHLTNTTATTTAAIDQRPITVTAVADTKVYDGTTSSDETPAISSGTIASGDTAAFSQAFATKAVGTGKTLIPSGSVSDGNGGDNYAVTFVNASSGVITAKNLTVSGITASDKPYDGNTSAALNVSGAGLVGVVAGDLVTLGTGGASGAFTSSAPGTCTVLVTGLTIAGADSANYTLTQPVVTACIGAWYAAGFYAPVGVGNSQFVTSPGAPPAVSPVSTVWNIAKGGSTIPLKFNLYTSQGGAERTNVADIRQFDAVKLSCTTGEGEDAVDFITSGNTSLRYDGVQFIQNWKTPSSNTDTCYRASVKFQDGSAIYAFFKLRK
jgi:YDG domain